MARSRGRPKGSTKAHPVTSQAANAATTTPTRRTSGRLQSSATKLSTAKKSLYFEGGSDTSAGGDEDSSKSGYEEDAPSATSPSDDNGDETPTSEEDGGSRKRKRGRASQGAGSSRKAARGAELWREGVKSHLAPGEELVIKLPQARKAGATPYRDDTIHPNTLLFLGDLKRHNEREWLKMHDADFRQAQRDFASFVEKLTERLIERDETVPELPAKDLIFRIYRDVRFSSNPTPYKTHFSAAWSRTGKKGPYAAYYVQVAPGKSFVGGGLWCPEPAPLALLRQDVDRNPNGLKAVLGGDELRSKFLGGAKGEKQIVKAFTGQNADNALKRHPKVFRLILAWAD